MKVFLILLVTFSFLSAQEKKKPEYNEKYHKSGEDKFVKIFDGKTFKGWEGDQKWFRIQDGAIVAGKTTEKIPHNFFLATEKKYYNFELRLQVKMDNTIRNNGGIQFRSSRIPNHHEVKGYQADVGMKYWGMIYDESRRKKFVGKSIPFEETKKILKDGWNDYTIVCENNRVRTFLNGYMITEINEEDKEIAKTDGIIAVQIHGGRPLEIFYRNIRIRELDLKK